MPFPLSLQTIQLSNETLELFVPEEDAVRSAYRKGEIEFPYWSKIWPAAIAMATYLLQHPEYTENKTVIELGAGLGLPSLIAARNAISVLCTDYAAEAVNVAGQSAKYHGLDNFTTALIDWTNIHTKPLADVLLLSDVNYEPAVFSSLQKVIDQYLNDGTTILLTTPQRLMAKEFINHVLPFVIETEQLDVAEEGSNVAISVFVLRK